MCNLASSPSRAFPLVVGNAAAECDGKERVRAVEAEGGDRLRKATDAKAVLVDGRFFARRRSEQVLCETDARAWVCGAAQICSNKANATAPAYLSPPIPDQSPTPIPDPSADVANIDAYNTIQRFATLCQSLRRVGRPKQVYFVIFFNVFLKGNDKDVPL